MHLSGVGDDIFVVFVAAVMSVCWFVSYICCSIVAMGRLAERRVDEALAMYGECIGWLLSFKDDAEVPFPLRW